MSQMSLALDPVVVHCFWAGSCSHTVESFDPVDAHDRMEQHYAEHHDTVRCSTCIRTLAELRPGETTHSRAFVNHVHWLHRPMHPHEVGANHHKRARREWAQWEVLA